MCVYMTKFIHKGIEGVLNSYLCPSYNWRHKKKEF